VHKDSHSSLRTSQCRVTCLQEAKFTPAQRNAKVLVGCVGHVTVDTVKSSQGLSGLLDFSHLL